MPRSRNYKWRLIKTGKCGSKRLLLAGVYSCVIFRKMVEIQARARRIVRAVFTIQNVYKYSSNRKTFNREE